MSKRLQPNFLIIGAAKAATTSLSSLLGAHPEAGIVKGKEPHFFSDNRRYQQGWEAYLRLYLHCSSAKAVGDASTSYSRVRYHPQTIERIRRHIPEARIIYMVRHPLERMESAYVEHMGSPGGRAFESINHAVRRMPMIIDSSRYWEVFDAYRKAFDESKIKIVWFEEYTARQAEVFQDVCRFLQIDDSVEPSIDQEQANSRQNAMGRMSQLGKGEIEVNTGWDDETRAWVIDQIREDNCQFLDHFGKQRDHWGPLFG